MCECKSKILVLSSLKGKLESIEKDFKDAIGKAYEQAIRTEKWIMDKKKFELNQAKGSSKMINLNKTKQNFKLCIVAENFGWIASNISDYIKVEDKKDLPLIFNIYDLDIITKELKNYKEFINYLEFRNKYQDKVAFVDELEMFCAFKYEAFKDYGDEEIDKVFIYGFIEATEALDEKYGNESEIFLTNYNV